MGGVGGGGAATAALESEECQARHMKLMCLSASELEPPDRTSGQAATALKGGGGEG